MKLFLSLVLTIVSISPIAHAQSPIQKQLITGIPATGGAFLTKHLLQKAAAKNTSKSIEYILPETRAPGVLSEVELRQLNVKIPNGKSLAIQFKPSPKFYRTQLIENEIKKLRSSGTRSGVLEAEMTKTFPTDLIVPEETRFFAQLQATDGSIISNEIRVLEMNGCEISSAMWVDNTLLAKAAKFSRFAKWSKNLGIALIIYDAAQIYRLSDVPGISTSGTVYASSAALVYTGGKLYTNWKLARKLRASLKTDPFELTSTEAAADEASAGTVVTETRTTRILNAVTKPFKKAKQIPFKRAPGPLTPIELAQLNTNLDAETSLLVEYKPSVSAFKTAMIEREIEALRSNGTLSTYRENAIRMKWMNQTEASMQSIAEKQVFTRKIMAKDGMAILNELNAITDEGSTLQGMAFVNEASVARLAKIARSGKVLKIAGVTLLFYDLLQIVQMMRLPSD